MAKTVEEGSAPAAKKRGKAAKAPEANQVAGTIQAEEYAFGAVPSYRYYKPKKIQITLRVDADVIEWFRKNHPRYQTLMNAVLRKEMMQALAEESRERRNGHHVF